MGYCRITRAGVAELGESLLSDRDEIPDWVLDPLLDIEDLPWWIPDDYDGQRSLSCQHCGRTTPAKDILTPGAVGQGTTDRFCRECWQDIKGRWEPGFGLRE